jgi:hypothetical protein
MKEASRSNPHRSVTTSARNPDKSDVAFLRLHLLSGLLVVAAVGASGLIFAVSRPQYRPAVMPSPPNDLPYTRALYTAQDVRRAFAPLELVRRSRLPVMTDFSDRSLRVEVTVFGDPAKVKAMGSFEYRLGAHGRFVRYPRTRDNGARNAARWRGNVRAIVRCGDGADAALRRVAAALGRL